MTSRFIIYKKDDEHWVGEAVPTWVVQSWSLVIQICLIKNIGRLKLGRRSTNTLKTTKTGT